MNITESNAKKTSIILLSSGLDSTVSLAIAKDKTDVKLALNISYGQLAESNELHFAQRIADFYEVPFMNIKLPWYSDLYNFVPPLIKSLTECTKDNIENVWFPNRNHLFISIAASFAESKNIDQIIIGTNKDEAENFPDNSKEFVESCNNSLSFSTLKDVKVISYLENLTKNEIAQLAVKLNIPIKLVYSCYRNENLMCGECESCLRFFKAFNEIGEFEFVKDNFYETFGEKY